MRCTVRKPLYFCTAHPGTGCSWPLSVGCVVTVKWDLINLEIGRTFTDLFTLDLADGLTSKSISLNKNPNLLLKEYFQEAGVFECKVAWGEGDIYSWGFKFLIDGGEKIEWLFPFFFSHQETGNVHKFWVIFLDRRVNKEKTLLFMDLFLNFLFQARKWPECATP